MREKLTTQAKELLKVFPEIPIEKANEVDIEIKKKVMAYQPMQVNEDISKYIQTVAICDYIRGNNCDKIKKKSNKLAAYYLENNKLWILQENWYCLLAYIITIITMICRVLELETTLNDKLSCGMYFGALVVWLLLVKSKSFMGEKAEKFLKAFNNHAPSMIIISSLLFYLIISICSLKVVWVAVIFISVISCIWITALWYKRQKEV